MPEVDEGKYLVQAGHDDVPHLDAVSKALIAKSTLPHMRDARTKGIPSLGAGAIYPIPESEIKVAPMVIPVFWPKVYALDVGWNRTACLWGAWDRSTDCVYLYAEYYRAKAEPSIHARAIQARGEWVPGVIDPAARGRSQRDGEQLIVNYRDLGLKLDIAVNSVESGLDAVWERMSTGRLKVFSTLQNWWAEYRLYRRDKDGKIVKEFDHLMDDTRYLIVSGLSRAIVEPVASRNEGFGSAGGGDRKAGY